MALDVELYRCTLYIPIGNSGKNLRRISVIDIHPEGAVRTFVFIHGYGGSALQWLYQLQFFGQTVRVIAPDLRGHGHSDDPSTLAMSMNGLVNDLGYVLDALKVERPFALIAHSFGGAIAIEYALRHPEDLTGLVLIGVPKRFVVRSSLLRLLNVPDPIFNWAAKQIKVALFASQPTLKRMYNTVLTSWRGHERLQQLHVPTLVILGQRDTVFLRQDYEDVPRSIPGAHQVVIPVSAHLVQLERPDAVNRAIKRFLEPKSVSTKEIGTSSTASASSTISHAMKTAQRLAEMPWLQHYDTDVPEEVPLPKELIHDMLSNAAQDFPSRPALIFFGQKIGYRELDLISNRFAHALRKLGVQQGERVAIILPNVPQCVIAFYGTLKAGAVVVLGSPLSNEDEIAYQLRNSEARVLLTLSAYRQTVQRVCADTNIQHVIYTDVREYLPVNQRVLLASLIGSSHQPLSERPAALPGMSPTTPGEPIVELTQQAANGDTKLSNVTSIVPLNSFAAQIESPSVPTPTHISWKEHEFQQLLRKQPTTIIDGGTTSESQALLQYTSGTTDSPKGVMLSHSNLMVNVVQKRHWMPDSKRGSEIVLCVLPLSHIYGVTSAMNISMALAGSLVLLPTTRTDQVLEAIKHHHPTIFPGVPALYLAIANYPKVRSYGVSFIRICVSGSAPLPVEVQEAFEKLTRGRLVEGYGLTEASPVTHSNPLKGERRVGSIGIPMPSTRARIVDLKTGETLPAGEVGELLIAGPQVMRGYWKMPEETAQALTDGWLHTGDLARMDEDGFFTIVDRKKDLILSGSYNVYPRDVEEVLYEHPKVLEAAVVSAPTKAGTQDTTASPFIKAVVVLKRGEKATPAELLAFCRERLDSYKVPRQIEFRSELPKNLVGKVLRRLLVEV